MENKMSVEPEPSIKDWVLTVTPADEVGHVHTTPSSSGKVTGQGFEIIKCLNSWLAFPLKPLLWHYYLLWPNGEFYKMDDQGRKKLSLI